MKVAIATDHNGVEQKLDLIYFISSLGYEVVDYSKDNTPTDDYPDFAERVAKSVSNHETDLGILLCGTGIGMSIAVNRYSGIRAALCCNSNMAEMSRKPNNSNVLVLGARVVTKEIAFDCFRKFIETEFEGGRHQRRVDMIDDFVNNTKK